MTGYQLFVPNTEITIFSEVFLSKRDAEAFAQKSCKTYEVRAVKITKAPLKATKNKK